jgi:hypothetical protein
MGLLSAWQRVQEVKCKKDRERWNDWRSDTDVYFDGWTQSGYDEYDGTYRWRPPQFGFYDGER